MIPKVLTLSYDSIVITGNVVSRLVDGSLSKEIGKY